MLFRILLFIYFFIFIQCSLNKNITENKAQEIYLRNLEYIESYLEGNTQAQDSSLKIISVIAFFETLTSIPSHSDGTLIGKFAATDNDVTRWRNWYEKNRKKLAWNDVESKIILTSPAEY